MKACGLEQTNSHDLTALTNSTNYRSDFFTIFSTILLCSKIYVLDAIIDHVPAFLLENGHFLKSDRLKALLAHVAIFLFCRSSTHAMDRRHSLCLPFRTNSVTCLP